MAKTKTTRRSTPKGAPEDVTTTYEIHPAIGIARLGTSDEYFLAPEPACDDALYIEQTDAVNPPAAKPQPEKFRDGKGNLKRQAVRFRVFKCQRKNGKLVKAWQIRKGIEWSVHVANRKASADCFPIEKINDPAGQEKNKRRNSKIEDQKSLEIDSGKCAVTAHNDETNRVLLEGDFRKTRVKLGEAFMDEQGRLVVLGGSGKSGYVVLDDDAVEEPVEITEFANNDYWYDDTCDGIIQASVTLPGENPPEVAAARVVVGPFDFAPQVKSFVTLYDIAYQAAADRAVDDPNWSNGLPGFELTTDFNLHVLPILERTRGYRWVNSPTMRADVRDKHAAWRPGIAPDPLFTLLGDPHPKPGSDPDYNKLINRAISLRMMFLMHLRNPDDDKAEIREVKMPRLHDDDNNDNAVLPLTRIQYGHMKNWAHGAFTNTDPADTAANGGGEFVCEAMDRIALEACSGGPFYPGMELPRIARDEDKYIAPFRFDPKIEPGVVTQGLAVPWQADFFKCQMDGDNGWWPATRPDKVIVLKQGDALNPKIMSDVMSEHMEEWDNNVADMNDMVGKWHQLGIVKRVKVEKDAPPIAEGYQGPGMSGYLYVEDERTLARELGRSLKP